MEGEQVRNGRPQEANPFAQIIALCEIAAMLGVSENTVLRWHQRHGLPLMQRGPRGRIVGDRQAVAVWHRRFVASRGGLP